MCNRPREQRNCNLENWVGNSWEDYDYSQVAAKDEEAIEGHWSWIVCKA